MKKNKIRKKNNKDKEPGSLSLIHKLENIK